MAVKEAWASWRVVLAAVALATAVPAAMAERPSGEFRLGWREVWVGGDDAKYRQHLNLDDGPRLFDLTLRWQEPPAGEGADEAASLVPDRVEVRLSDLGGDPYESAALLVQRTGRYRLTYDRQESEYFYADILVLPEEASVERSDAGDFRRFDFRRIRDRAALVVDLSARTAIALSFDSYRKRGDSTLPVDVEREEFEVDRPVDETMESVELGFSHAWDRVTVALSERYRRFDFASAAFLPGSSEGSDPAAPTRLEYFFLDQPYELESREHELNVTARPSERLRVNATVLWADVDIDLEAAERARGDDFAGTPFTRELTGTGAVDQQRALYQVRGSYAFTPRLGVFGELRRVSLEQDGALAFDGDAATDWRIDTTRLEAGAEATAAANLRVAVGVHRERRDVDFRDSAVGLEADEDTDADGYFARLHWRPSRRADIALSVEDSAVDDPFTLASPTDSRRYRARARYRWDGGVTLTGSWRSTERRNDNTGWHADAEQLEARLGYAGERLSWSAGVSRVDISRSVDTLVLAGSRQVLFAIDYEAVADFADASISWRFGPNLTASASARRYDNGRSFPVERDDVRIYVSGTLREPFHWMVDYRRVEFAEGGIEHFDADLLELSLGARW